MVSLGHALQGPPETEYLLAGHREQLDASCCISQSCVLVILGVTHRTGVRAGGTILARGVSTTNAERIGGTSFTFSFTIETSTRTATDVTGSEVRLARLTK